MAAIGICADLDKQSGSDKHKHQEPTLVRQKKDLYCFYFDTVDL